MTTFTSDDRNEAYQKKVEEAPYHPGYEDAVVSIRSEPIYAGMNPSQMTWKPKPLDLETILICVRTVYGFKEMTKTDLDFVREIEKAHGIK
jgi:hypothetical protein